MLLLLLLQYGRTSPKRAAFFHQGRGYDTWDYLLVHAGPWRPEAGQTPVYKFLMDETTLSEKHVSMLERLAGCTPLSVTQRMTGILKEGGGGSYYVTRDTFTARRYSPHCMNWVEITRLLEISHHAWTALHFEVPAAVGIRHKCCGHMWWQWCSLWGPLEKMSGQCD